MASIHSPSPAFYTNGTVASANSSTGTPAHSHSTSPFPSVDRQPASTSASELARRMQNGSMAGGHVSDRNAEVGQTSTNGHSTSPDYTSLEHLQRHNGQIIEHIYNAGFNLGEFADTYLTSGNLSWHLHAIILSRSPYLARLLAAAPRNNGAMMWINPQLENYPEVTEEGFHIAISYLYSGDAMYRINALNSRGALAAACLLGGMDDLAHQAYITACQSICVESIVDWLAFVESLPRSEGLGSPAVAPRRPSVLEGYGMALREEVFNFLVARLPAELNLQSNEGRTTLLNVFAQLEFDTFKSAVESPRFPIGSDQERFQFAKAAITMRKNGRAGRDLETVVLAFGGSGQGSTVHVTRKTKPRKLFKIES